MEQYGARGVERGRARVPPAGSEETRETTQHPAQSPGLGYSYPFLDRRGIDHLARGGPESIVKISKGVVGGRVVQLWSASRCPPPWRRAHRESRERGERWSSAVGRDGAEHVDRGEGLRQASRNCGQAWVTPTPSSTCRGIDQRASVDQFVRVKLSKGVVGGRVVQQRLL